MIPYILSQKMHSHSSNLWIIVSCDKNLNSIIHSILPYLTKLVNCRICLWHFYFIFKLQISNFQFKPQLVNCPICLWHFYFIFKLQILRHKFYTYPISATISFSNIKYEIFKCLVLAIMYMLSLFSNLLVTFLLLYSLIPCIKF